MGLPRNFLFRRPWLYTTILDTKARHTNKSHASFSHHHSLSFIYLFIFNQNLPLLKIKSNNKTVNVIVVKSVPHTRFLIEVQFVAKMIMTLHLKVD